MVKEMKKLIEDHQASSFILEKHAAKVNDGKTKEDVLKNYNDFKRKMKTLINRGEEFCSKFTPSTNNASSSITPSQTASSSSNKHHNLQRLPLPTFNGSKIDYLQFKKEFNNHVLYETEAEKLQALKSTCLKKNFDKEKVRNLDSLKDCWDVLDKKYGNIPTLVSEIYNKWRNLKMPKNDPEFVKFAEEIETGAHVLKSMDFYKSMDNCYLTIEMESKLNEILRREYSKTYLKPNADPLKRWENFLLFVEEEKIAAESRIASFAPIPSKELDGETGGHFAGTQGGKGGGADSQTGGKSGGGKKYGGKSSQGKRGKESDDCLVCGEDHQTSKCYK